MYAVVVWFFAFRWRRSWRGLAAVLIGAGLALGLGLAVPTLQVTYFNVNPNQAGGAAPLRLLVFAEAGLVLGGGLLIVSLARPPAHPHCPFCHYDTRGLETTQSTCPECGQPIHGFPPPPRRGGRPISRATSGTPPQPKAP